VAVHPLDLVGVDVRGRHSTVVGRLRITLLSGVAPQAAVTASQTSRAKSSSVAVKVSGLYSSTHSVSGCSAASCLDELDGGDGHGDDLGLAHAEDVVAEGLEVAL
jgi:hypothetical protein